MTSIPKDFAAGQVLAAAAMDQLPQGILAVARTTSSVGPTSGTTELDIITAAAVTLLTADRRIRVSFHCRGLSCSASSGESYTLRIKEGSTTLQEAAYVPSATGTASIGADFDVILDAPSAASHTYKATIQRAIGAGTASVSATATGPITLTVEDAGQV